MNKTKYEALKAELDNMTDELNNLLYGDNRIVSIDF